MITRWMMKLKILKTAFMNSNVANDVGDETKKRDAVQAAGNVDHHHRHHDPTLLLLLHYNQHKLLNHVDPQSVAIVATARVEGAAVVTATVEARTRAVVDPVLAAEAAVVAAAALDLRMTVVIDDGDDAVARYRLEAAVPANPRMTVGVNANKIAAHGQNANNTMIND